MNKYVRIIVLFCSSAMIFIFKEKQMKRKVAAYCRVSTKKEIQQYSLEAQKQYYKNLINSNEDFILFIICSNTNL